ncbi:hypothetical protein QQP08_004338 [Theobroma cacao]|nr:hypothetical protein QQP08_004338 [Theobroma cacao]
MLNGPSVWWLGIWSIIVFQLFLLMITPPPCCWKVEVVENSKSDQDDQLFSLRGYALLIKHKQLQEISMFHGKLIHKKHKVPPMKLKVMFIYSSIWFVCKLEICF